MNLVKVEIDVPKEMLDVKTFLVELVADIKAKKNVGAIASENLPNLVAAIDGFSALGEEAKSEQANNLYGLLVADLIKVLK
jgi:hypothetical protein